MKKGYRDICEPDWNKFRDKYQDKIEEDILNDSRIIYLVNNPPKQQIINSKNKIGWKDIENRNKVKKLILSLKTIRNNLFHGGKYPCGEKEEDGRNKKLLEHGIYILLSLKDIDTKVKEYFEYDI